MKEISELLEAQIIDTVDFMHDIIDTARERKLDASEVSIALAVVRSLEQFLEQEGIKPKER